MTLEETIQRINELYHKSQKEGLSEEEKQEQKQLRQVYIDSVKNKQSARSAGKYGNRASGRYDREGHQETPG